MIRSRRARRLCVSSTSTGTSRPSSTTRASGRWLAGVPAAPASRASSRSHTHSASGWRAATHSRTSVTAAMWGQRTRVGAPQRELAARQSLAAPVQPHEHRLAHQQRPAPDPTCGLPARAKPARRVNASTHQPGQLRKRDGVLLTDDPQQLEVPARAAHHARIRTAAARPSGVFLGHDRLPRHHPKDGRTAKVAPLAQRLPPAAPGLQSQ